jgi:hypothetical protein
MQEAFSCANAGAQYVFMTPLSQRNANFPHLTPTEVLAVPKNMKLLAIPLFELYDNAARYV